MNREEKLSALKDLIEHSDRMLGLDSSYTLEQFESDMENASPNQMEGFLMKAVDNLDVSNKDVLESLQKYKEELKDIKDQMATRKNDDIAKGIESGKYELFKCIKELNTFKVGESYYVYFDRPSDFLPKDTIESLSVNSDIAKYIDNNIKETASIVKDDGIGTLKKEYYFGLTKVITKGGIEIGRNFLEYFEKVSK